MRRAAERDAPFVRSIRAQRRRRQRRHWLGVGFALALLFYVMIFGDAGWLAVRDAEEQVGDLRAELETLRTERAAHERATEALLEPGGHELERVARELYRMQRPHEEVHHLVGGERADPPDGPS
ncbi:MAG TPA: septum formation initiator family protein [Candidatus Krumholzibacteria bacterium]|nr:septum formation initiator family protein [Candidatus Krumholzibacteria bacterium]